MQNGEVMVVEVTHQISQHVSRHLSAVIAELLSANFYAVGKYSGNIVMLPRSVIDVW